MITADTIASARRLAMRRLVDEFAVPEAVAGVLIERPLHAAEDALRSHQESDAVMGALTEVVEQNVQRLEQVGALLTRLDAADPESIRDGIATIAGEMVGIRDRLAVMEGALLARLQATAPDTDGDTEASLVGAARPTFGERVGALVTNHKVVLAALGLGTAMVAAAGSVLYALAGLTGGGPAGP